MGLEQEEEMCCLCLCKLFPISRFTWQSAETGSLTHSRAGRCRKARFRDSFSAVLRKLGGVIMAAHLELGI